MSPNVHQLIGLGSLSIIHELIEEGLRMPHGTREIVYFDPNKDILGFGEPLETNTLPDDIFKVGELASLDLEDVDCAKEISDNFIEINNRLGRIDPDFQDHYIRYYTDGSIVKKEMAQEYLSKKALVQHWYDDILNEIEDTRRHYRLLH